MTQKAHDRKKMKHYASNLLYIVTCLPTINAMSNN